MQKMVQFIPADPKIVLAMEITELTWPYFLMLSGGKTPLDKSTTLGGIITVPVDTECAWGWMNHDEFLECYQPDEAWLDGRFTSCQAIK